MEIRWINFLKGMAIVAVVIDHLYGIVYENGLVRGLTVYSVTLFIFLVGITSSISIERNKIPYKKRGVAKQGFQTFPAPFIQRFDRRVQQAMVGLSMRLCSWREGLLDGITHLLHTVNHVTVYVKTIGDPDSRWKTLANPGVVSLGQIHYDRFGIQHEKSWMPTGICA